MSVQQNPGAARVIDPILTTAALGYKQPELVGSSLFPVVPVDQNGGKIITFGKEQFQAYNTLRAPGSAIKRIQIGYAGGNYSLELHTLAAQVPWENQRDANAVPGIDLSTRSVQTVMGALALELEVAQAAIALSAANYDANHKIALAGVSKWSDNTSDPIAQITTYREAIRTTTGRYPNTAAFSPQAWNAFRNNANVKSRIQYVATAMVTSQIAAALLEIENVVIGRAVQADAAGNFTDVWGNNCVLSYSAIGSLSAEEPSYGYTYTMRGHPNVMQGWFDPNTNSWVYPTNFERAPVLSGVTAGFLVQNPA